MRVLMVGGAGTVGRAVIPHLGSAYRVTVFDRVEPDLPGVACIVGDAMDVEALERAMTDADAIVHLAAIVPRGAESNDPERIRAAFDLNVTGVYLALQAAIAHDIRSFVHISTMSVYAEYGRMPVDASASPDSTQPYGQSKRLAESLCGSLSREAEMTVTSLRLAYPTTDDLWPRWRSPGTPDAEPLHPTLNDGTQFNALAPSDLARALEAALHRHGPYAAVPVTGDTDGVSLLHDPAPGVLRRRTSTASD